MQRGDSRSKDDLQIVSFKNNTSAWKQKIYLVQLTPMINVDTITCTSSTGQLYDW